MPAKDPQLEKGLKDAKGTKSFFAFIPTSGGKDGKLIVRKMQIKDKELTEERKKIGGGKPVKGKCKGEFDGMKFEVAQEQPKLADAIKKVAKREASLTIIADVVVAADAEADGEEVGVVASEAGAGATAEAGADAGVAEFTGRLQELNSQAQEAQVDESIAQQIKEWASQAATQAGKKALDVANALLDKVEAALKSVAKGAKGVVDAVLHQQVVSKKAEVDKYIAALEKHPQAKHIAKDIDSAKAKAATALKLSEPPHNKHKEALKALNMIDAALGKAEVMADVKGGTADPAKIKKLAGKPEGAKALDDLVASLPDDAPQKLLDAAIEARFDVKFEQYEHKKPGAVGDLSGATAVDPELPDKSLKRVYELLNKVPKSHTRDNPKLKEIIRFTKDTGGAAYGGGKIYLYCGRADNTQPYQLAKPSELPEVDENCKPKDNVKPDYFDFATLHEVGHAVDDRDGFMKKNMAADAHGGWKTESVDSLAEVASKKFGFDKDYIKDLLSNKTPPPPAAPSGTKPEDWQKAKDKADNWCAGIREKKGLWWDGANSIALAIDGRVYHESYKNKWVSYKLDARKKGISGYQFRAPGEHFAELYAAYHSGKLKDSNPAVSWLKDL